MTIRSISCGLSFFNPFVKMPSLPRIRDSINFAFFRGGPRAGNDLEDLQIKVDSLSGLINEHIEKLIRAKALKFNDSSSPSLGSDVQRSPTLPLFRYDAGPTEIKLSNGCGESESYAEEDLGIFTEKCVISFNKPFEQEQDKPNSSNPTSQFGDLRIVIGLECANPKPGIQFHRLKNLEVSGFGPTRWTITAFYKDVKVFERNGISNAPKCEKVNLGNFDFSFIA